MSISITPDPSAIESTKTNPLKHGEIAKIKLKAKSTVDGNIIIFDHKYIDIVLMPKASKIMTFPKEELTDDVYETQMRFFRELADGGIVNLESVQAGSVFMSMEGAIPQSETYKNVNQIAMLAIYKFIERERPMFEYITKMEDWEEERLSDPPEDETTEWDPGKYHREEKGSIKPNMRPYGVPGVYRF